MRKKALRVLMSLCLCLTMLPVAAFANEGESGAGAADAGQSAEEHHVVTISALPQNAAYDRNPHSGCSDVTGVLESGATYTGSFSYAYATAAGSSLGSAPTEVGDYKVTITPEDDGIYSGSLTLSFSIIEESEAYYQLNSSSDRWACGSLDQALSGVCQDGSIKLIKNVELTHAAVARRGDVTITSRGSDASYVITRANGYDGALLSVTSGCVALKDVIIDGGSANGVSAASAAVVVDGENATLMMGSGAAIKNNNNASEDGKGGGVQVLGGGTLTLQGGSITGNLASKGAGAYLHAGAKVRLHGGSLSGNSATELAGGVACEPGSEVSLGGAPVASGNTSPVEVNGGVYLMGEDGVAQQDADEGGADEGGAAHDVFAFSALEEGANVMFRTWDEREGAVVVGSGDHALTAADMQKLGYDSTSWCLVLEDGQAVLAATVAIDASAGEGGSITPSGQMVVRKGTDQVFDITPDEGYVIADVLVDGESVGAVESYEFRDVASNHSINATFSAIQPSGGTDGNGAGGSGDSSADGATKPLPGGSQGAATGDSSHVGLWFALLIGGGALMALAAVLARRKRSLK